MSDVLVRAIDSTRGLRVLAAVTTDLVSEAARRHHAVGLCACALGRALTASALLATLTKGGERLTLQIRGDGPLGGVTSDSYDDGCVRGFPLRPDDARKITSGRGRVVEVLGRDGIVNVVRDIGLGEVYQGQSGLVTGEVDEDVEGYLRSSEQVPSALGCDVFVDGEAGVRGAAGVLVQALPGTASDELREVQHALRTGAVYDFLRAGGGTARELAERVYGHPIEVVGETPLRFQCRCSADRVESMLAVLTPVDIDEMIAESGQAEVTCNFCNERYVVGRETLEKIRAAVGGPRGNN